MASRKNNSPDFFEDHSIDPMAIATGTRTVKPVIKKKKAGFYLSEDILERFDRKFHELKLSGVAIANKSVIMEMALASALDDLDRGDKSLFLKKLTS